MDFHLDGLDQSPPEQEILFETMDPQNENEAPDLNDDNEQDVFDDPQQEEEQDDADDQVALLTRQLAQLLQQQQQMQTSMTAFGLAVQRDHGRITSLTQQLTNLGQTPSTPVNTTPQTTTGIQTIPQETPPATPSRAAVSQNLGS